MIVQGKGFYIWRIQNCEGGDPQAIASVAREADLTHILVKVADGVYTYNYDWEAKKDLVPPVTKALRAEGIQVWGWHYVYGDAPMGEARKAIERVVDLDLDGYVIDAESQYKQAGKRTAAKRFMRELRAGLRDLPIALSSYRYPSYHPQLPWREFLEKCDLNMPQVYWQSAHNPGTQLSRSVREFQSMTPSRPIVPTGAAYRVGDWEPTPRDIRAFLRTAQKLNLSGANFWEWSRARSGSLIRLWNAVRDFPWPGGNNQGDLVERFIAALNTHDARNVIKLYGSNPAHVTSDHTLSGRTALQNWYQNLLEVTLPKAKFKLSSFSGSGNTRHFTWTAQSSKGTVDNGNDLFGLVDGRIIYHYSHFKISSR